jgi:hypothetical protein
LISHQECHPGATKMHSPFASSRASGSSRKRCFSSIGSLASPSQSLSCKRCRSRKVKCDAALPTCAGCSKARVLCIVADSSTSREFTRSEVHELEERLLRLESALREGDRSEAHGRVPPQPSIAFSEATPDTEITSSPTSTRYVGREAGVG